MGTSSDSGRECPCGGSVPGTCRCSQVEFFPLRIEIAELNPFLRKCQVEHGTAVGFLKTKKYPFHLDFLQESQFLSDSHVPLGKRGCPKGSSHRAVPAPTNSALKHRPPVRFGAAAPAGTQHCPSVLRLVCLSSLRLGGAGKQGKPAAPLVAGLISIILEARAAPQLGTALPLNHRSS